jgi:hypothetical protein
MATSISTIDQVYEALKKEQVTHQTVYSFIHKQKTKNKSVNMQLGRIWFNLLLPDNYQLVNEPITKPVLDKIIFEIFNNESDPAKLVSFLDNMNKEAFKMSSIVPVSYNIDSLIVPDFILDKKEKLKEIKDIGILVKETNKLGEELVQYWEESDFNIASLVKGKITGKANVKAMANFFIARGVTTDIEGTSTDFSFNNITDGFNLKEFYENASASRGGFYIRSVGSAEPGVLARDVVYANSNIKLSNSENCGSKKYLEISITPTLASVLNDRYIITDNGELELVPDMSKYIGKTVKVRSPLYCKALDGICPTCYGELSRKTNSKNIGITAGVSINAILVQGAMQARHSVGGADSKVNFIKDIIKIA